ncbi:hypothetical protein ACP275_09G003000 [Erythranthe tilingii]
MPSRHLRCYFFPHDRTNHCEDKLKKAKILQHCSCFESPVDCVTGRFGRIWLPKYLCNFPRDQNGEQRKSISHYTKQILVYSISWWQQSFSMVLQKEAFRISTRFRFSPKNNNFFISGYG